MSRLNLNALETKTKAGTFGFYTVLDEHFGFNYDEYISDNHFEKPNKFAESITST